VVAWIVLRREHFRIEQGAPVAFRSSPPVERTFCGRCGTPLTYRHDNSPASIDIQTATLDAPDAFAPRREIWLDEKLAWMPRNERLEPYPHGSP
jgi:hypothetical protein